MKIDKGTLKTTFTESALSVGAEQGAELVKEATSKALLSFE